MFRREFFASLCAAISSLFGSKIRGKRNGIDRDDYFAPFIPTPDSEHFFARAGGQPNVGLMLVTVADCLEIERRRAYWQWIFWNDVNEKLPELIRCSDYGCHFSETVLVVDSIGLVSTGQLWGTPERPQWNRDLGCFVERGEVTHWSKMPLPPSEK